MAAATAAPTPAAPESANAPAVGSLAVGAQFREIHKNTWLKRLTADGKKLTVGPKKSECSWVVFCVHDDTEALLEGYAEPRQAAAHMPEWAVSLRETLHISHALIPNSHEFEFVVTLSNEVLRFHAVSWEIMQEWVETLRSKLREMKILSPRENLYTKLPEVRAPLLPTRDPTSPLPAPPPVPAAMVPGVERVVTTTTPATAAIPALAVAPAATVTPPSAVTSHSTSNSAAPVAPPPTTAMSNTLSQNLLNLLSDPISTYSEQISETTTSPVPSDPAVVEYHGITGGSISNDDDDVNLSDDEFLSPLLRKACIATDNGVRVDVVAQRASADPVLNLEHMLQCERLIPRPQTSRSMSAGAADKSRRPPRRQQQAHGGTTSTAVEEPQDNITIIQVSNATTNGQSQPPELPPKTNNIVADVFRFPEINVKSKTTTTTTTTTGQLQHTDYKSNVQIIPSNASTIQVLGQQPSSSSTASTSNPYTMPVKPNASNTTNLPQISNTNTTKVQVLCEGPTNSDVATTTVAVYGTCYPIEAVQAGPSCSTGIASASPAAKPKTPKLSKKIILSANTSGITSISVNHEENTDPVITGNVHYEKVFLSSSIPISNSNSHTRSPTRLLEAERSLSSSGPPPIASSPALPRRRLASPTNGRRMPQLNRGLTELVISTRPSRRDFHYLKLPNTPLKTKTTTTTSSSTQKTSSAANNNIEQQSTPRSGTGAPLPRNNHSNTVPDSESSVDQQRRRSSSTSDAQAPLQRAAASAAVSTQQHQSSQRSANNNDCGGNVFRMQSPPQVAASAAPSNQAQSSPSKRLTLREQQVMQLRREIMHPGVRLNLRRKDCVGSIAWVDAFGGVWIAGWKQKEHPVLYNALHIGDQLLSIAGVSISSAAEANKIIRNTNTLFVEVLLRRIPFGRAYAIRRDREGQCLGLIRDGNTSTIVDVVPNSLAARHGLPPKTQSCDGSTLTFWMLTEINGRTLNLFFKDMEIRDRLNSVGRDISILVQPSDLITKLKKQLKSLRGYKDYLVQ
ncbi:uncharacterized protein Dwil_GK12219 [Drosophila willistoni]|uniref:PH domain-containing protein n=1 Tax=Drosophila willistoni TaxID=7260 RepID=B4N9X7_DROWI|nr:mucin-5AC [Drosophila willistoni]EDW81732.1 uncharacterized protein Dwil_GK12219 [Drosophila willistoni]